MRGVDLDGEPRRYGGTVIWSGSDATPWQEADVAGNGEVARPDVPADVVVPPDVGALGTVASELDAIEAALGRIDAGSYGRCRACGASIADADLEADPLVLACAAHR